MSDELKYRNFYCEMMDIWMEEHNVEMTMENREQIRDHERAFNHVWTTVGRAIPPMRRTLSQIYYGM
jgi:hypothetical protein